MKKPHSDSSYTKQVKALRGKIFDDTRVKESLYEQSVIYFSTLEANVVKKQKLQTKVQEAEKVLASESNEKLKPGLTKSLKACERELKTFTIEIEEERLQRQKHLTNICHDIIDLTDGEDFKDTNKKTAKLLSTILLISPVTGRHVAAENEKSKHLYKAVLCLRLMDRLILDNNMMSSFIKNHCNMNNLDEESESFKNDDYREHVQIPIIMAALLQDIGNFHSDAQRILKGSEGNLNPYRPLNNEDRKELLKINYRETLRYVTAGIGAAKYVGNSKEDREEFNKDEQTKLKFTRALLKSWVNPENGVGNLLKIPQIYTSIILSTKPTYDYRLLPNAYNVLSESAAKGQFNSFTVEALLKVVGKFPMGYGVTYIPRDSDNEDLERYEYAVVTQLYPKDPFVPTCRQATKNLQYSYSGIDYVIGRENNLFFSSARKKLEQISENRLREILQLLSANYSEAGELDLIPKCWHPTDFFSFGKHQNLWNNMDIKTLD